jgi:hypothetical protein
MSDTQTEQTGVATRLLKAGEVLASAHAARAKEEASRDLSRILMAFALFGLAALLLMPACLLAHVGLVSWIHDRYGISIASASGGLAAMDVVLALLLALVARARLSSPVMVETRATLKRAVAVLRG